jgi:hypothetical protein
MFELVVLSRAEMELRRMQVIHQALLFLALRLCTRVPSPGRTELRLRVRLMALRQASSSGFGCDESEEMSTGFIQSMRRKTQCDGEHACLPVRYRGR